MASKTDIQTPPVVEIAEKVTSDVEDTATQAIVGEERAKVSEVYENPRLVPLKEQYEALSEEDRTHDGKIRSWQEVVNAIPNMPDFLAGVESLEQAQVYFLNEEGQLVLGDGCAEPLEETLGWNYHKSRTEATRISYIDNEGNVVVVDDDDTKIPSAQVISERGLITLEEYLRVNKGQFEKDRVIWVESGKNPSRARAADWRNVAVAWRDNNYPNYGDAYRGSRRVLRVNLNFEF
jgi:hypothetical protein